MTGHHLVLCDGPTGDARALQGAYARYLAGCCRQFLALGPELPPVLRAAHERVVALVSRALATDERRLLNCFASPTVGTPLRCLALRDELPAFRARIDEAVAALMPHLLLEMGLRRLIGDGETFVWSTVRHASPRWRSAGRSSLTRARPV